MLSIFKWDKILCQEKGHFKDIHDTKLSSNYVKQKLRRGFFFFWVLVEMTTFCVDTFLLSLHLTKLEDRFHLYHVYLKKSNDFH